MAEWPIPPPRFTVSGEAAALVVVDMQEMLCRRDKGLGVAVAATAGAADYFFERLTTVIESQQRLLESFRSSGRKVVFLTIGPNAADGSDLVPWRRRRNAEIRELYGVKYSGKGEGEHGVIPELEPKEGEIVLNKATFSPFASTGIEHLLRSWGVRYPIFCGQATNVCVYQTAAEAADRGFECVVVEDACAAWDEELHHAFLRNFALLYGRVETAESLLEELGA